MCHFQDVSVIIGGRELSRPYRYCVFSIHINCCFASKWAGSLEGEAFLADGVGEGDGLGVEHQARVGVAI